MTGPTVMVTGHRDTPDTIADELDRVLTKLAPAVAISGGADGADRHYAEAALRLGIPLHLMLPNQWYRHYYPGTVPDRVVEAATKVTYVVDRPTIPDWRYQWDKNKWWKDNYTRNAAMVTASDTTIVVSPHHPHTILAYVRSGTAGTVREVLRQRGEGHRVLWVPPPVHPRAPEPARWVPLRTEHALGDWSDFNLVDR
jgi:hypothetical protein